MAHRDVFRRLNTLIMGMDVMVILVLIICLNSLFPWCNYRSIYVFNELKKQQQQQKSKSVHI